MKSNNKEVKGTLAEVVSLMLIAVREGDMVVFPKEDNSVDYIQLLEACNKRPLLTYTVNDRGVIKTLDCYSNNEISTTLHIILSNGCDIIGVKVN